MKIYIVNFSDKRGSYYKVFEKRNEAKAFMILRALDGFQNVYMETKEEEK